MPRRRPSTSSRASSGRGATLLKWIGSITAVISLLLGARQVTTWVSDSLRQRREAATQVGLAQQQAARGAFAEAWASLDRAVAAVMNRGDDDGDAELVRVADEMQQRGEPLDPRITNLIDTTRERVKRRTQ